MEAFDVDSGRSGTGAVLSGTFGQEVSLLTMAGRGAERARRGSGFGGASWGGAPGWRLRTWGLAAGEAAGSPVHSTPSSFAPGPKAGQTFEASPSREPRGQLNHSRAVESPQSALRGLNPSNRAICENLAVCRFRATK